MTGLPGREELDPSKSYSAADVEHLVARKVAEHDLKHLRSTMEHMSQTNSNQFAEIQISMNTIRESLDSKFSTMYQHMGECREDLRKEIERDFATKTDLESLRGDMKQVATKVTMLISVVMLVINTGFKVWDEKHKETHTPQSYKQKQHARP